MAIVEANPNLGAQIVADAKEYVLYSWSVQSQIDPIPVAGASSLETRVFVLSGADEPAGSREIRFVLQSETGDARIERSARFVSLPTAHGG